MGYSHRFTQKKNFTRKDWYSFTEFVERLSHYKPTICGPGGYEHPIINEKDVIFNGDGEDAYDTFHISRVVQKQSMTGLPDGFGFCKTNRKPYDSSVVACLVFIHNQNRNRFDIRSDGNAGSWHDGYHLCKIIYPHHNLEIPDSI